MLDSRDVNTEEFNWKNSKYTIFMNHKYGVWTIARTRNYQEKQEPGTLVGKKESECTWNVKNKGLI